jgi:ribonuclease P protein component
VQNGGRRRHGADLVVLTLPRDAAETRLGVTVSGRVGGAVVRNRIKRVVRETFRRTRTGLPGGLDLVVIAKPSAAARSSRQLAAGVAEILPHA